MMKLRNPSRVLATSVALTAALVCGSPATAAPAPAYAAEGTTGQPGQVVLPQVQVSEVGTSEQDQRLTFHANTMPRVFRSHAVSTEVPQNVVAAYDLQRWNGSQWVTVAHQMAEGQLIPGESEIPLAMVWMQPPTSEGRYRITFSFGWSLSSAPDRALGGQSWTSSTADDLTCGGILRACDARSGHLVIGPPAP
ncbi:MULTISPECIES: hypothetical protein [Streptomyces]|uniref:Secreted protein n=1 Tax=Streptomyces venezuelae TaxID=54571 RepID=A0A5P2B083_STRVZ|nr:hypothetical protein [Streptomyces venezuelae]QES23198.1 hypothetical protein DEJ46_32100 [Streptomyces venezuelae]